MDGNIRREKILKILRESDEPVSGGKFAKNFNVSRQVLVQDIALLRAANHDIIATHKGYILQNEDKTLRVFKVKHEPDKMLDELNIIVDCGGKIEDEFVYHKMYGVIRVNMGVKSRRDAKVYVEEVNGDISLPLEMVTSGFHYHTVTADSEEVLDDIQDELQKNGYLVALRDYEPVDFWS